VATRDLKLTQTKKGFCRTIGHYIYDGKRVPRRFWLGHDRMQAKLKVEALEEAWENLSGERGQKIWIEQAIQAALNSFAPSSSSVPVALPSPIPAVAIPVFPPQPLPPSKPSRTFTLPEALDEFTSYFAERTDIGETHRTGTKSRIDSIKSHIEELFIENEEVRRSIGAIRTGGNLGRQ
jgi:hypothetical protein